MNHCGGTSAQGGSQIASSALLSAQHRLQIVLRLRGCASRLQNVGQSCQTITKSFLGGLLYRLRVRQTCSGSGVLSGRIQQTIVGSLNLEDEFAVNVVKTEVRRQESRAFRRDSAATGSEVRSEEH